MENTEQLYSEALALNRTANTIKELHRLAEILNRIVPYKDSVIMLSDTYARTDKERRYQRALWIMEEAETEEDYNEAAKILSKLNNYKDAVKLVREAQEAAKEAARKAREAAEEAERKAREAAEEAARKAKEAAEEAERKAKRKIMIRYVSFGAAIMLVIGIIYGVWEFNLYRERIAREEALRVLEEEARSLREKAMIEFFEEHNTDAKIMLNGLNLAKDPIIADMTAIADFGNSSKTYFRIWQEINSSSGTFSKYGSEAVAMAEQYAQQGSMNAKIFLGDIYFIGISVDRDINKSLEYYSGPSEKGNIYALTAAAEVYESRQDYEKAAELYRIAIQHGSRNAQKALQDVLATKKYMKEAAEGKPEAQYHAGLAYLKNPTPDYMQRALDLLNSSAKQNYAPALFSLAEIYETGRGVQQDYDKAIELYRKASAQKNSEADTRLGRIFYNVKRDYATARRYFVAPAKLGDPEAEYYIGLMFELGQVTAKNYGQALEWYKKAANQGYDKAIEGIARVTAERERSKRSIKGTQVNMRTEPDMNSNSVTRLDEGTPVEVIETRGRWYHVRLSSGKTGWVFSDYIQNRLDNRGTHGGEYKSVNGDEVNLRSGPGRRYNSLAKLYDGHLVEEVERSSRNGETWSRVYTPDGREGWIMSRYIRNRRSF